MALGLLCARIVTILYRVFVGRDSEVTLDGHGKMGVGEERGVMGTTVARNLWDRLRNMTCYETQVWLDKRGEQTRYDNAIKRSSIRDRESKILAPTVCRTIL